MPRIRCGYLPLPASGSEAPGHLTSVSLVIRPVQVAAALLSPQPALDPDLGVGCFHDLQQGVFLPHMRAYNVALLYDMFFTIRYDSGLARQHKPEFVYIVEVQLHGLTALANRRSHCCDAAPDLAPSRCTLCAEVFLLHNWHDCPPLRSRRKASPFTTTNIRSS